MPGFSSASGSSSGAFPSSGAIIFAASSARSSSSCSAGGSVRKIRPKRPSNCSEPRGTSRPRRPTPWARNTFLKLKWLLRLSAVTVIHTPPDLWSDAKAVFVTPPRMQNDVSYVLCSPVRCPDATFALLLFSAAALAQYVPPVLKGVEGEGQARHAEGPIPFPAADEVWQRVTSKHFVFVSAADEKRTREMAENLETLAAALGRLNPRFDAPGGPPPHVSV